MLAWLSPRGPINYLVIESISDARMLGLKMKQYAFDHEGRYPTGESSTEVFQHLMDQGYLTPNEASEILYIYGMPGKTRYRGTGPLQPENVCFDVIVSVDLGDNDWLPIVMSTGWKIPEFAEGVAPTVLDPAQAKTIDRYNTGWFEEAVPSLAFAREGGAAEFAKEHGPKHDGRLEQFFPPGIDFAPGKTYRQLRP
ncbi:MAG: hypothetical protein AAGK14_07395 [Verrucomicrobiota bacterium]